MIVVGGENLIDMVQTGVSESGVSFNATAGGSPYNVAMALGRQDAPVAYINPISNDSLGVILAQRLQDDNVVLLNAGATEPTSLAVVTLTEGIPSYQFYRDGTADRQITLDGLIASTPSDTRAFHTGSMCLAQGEDAQVLADYFAHARAQGVVTSFDPNIRVSLVDDRDSYIARLEKMMGETDLLKLSDEDLLWIYPEGDLEAAITTLRSKTSAKLIVITQGPDGAIGFSGDVRVDIDAHPVNPLVDTVGAGDTFMATLIGQMHREGHLDDWANASFDASDIERYLKTGSKAAALNCQTQGCNPPSLSEL